MLCLTRNAHERILIDGGRIVVEVVEVRRDGRVKLGVTAPPDVAVDREEVHRRRTAEGAGGGAPCTGGT